MEAKRRIVLVPVPAQGHVTPMMQLGKALNLKGFSITVVEGQFNKVSSSSQNFPGFEFVTIPKSLPESVLERLGPIEFLIELNKTSEASFKDCIAQLLLQQGNDIACIIYDEFMYFSGAAAKEFKIPSFIFSTSSAINQVSRCVLSKLSAEKFLVDMEDPEVQEKLVENLHPLRYKDLPTSGVGPLDRLFELCREIVNKRTASAVIINTVKCLESSPLTRLQHELGIPVYALGPLHITVSAASGLLEEDRSCIEWLNKQKPRSVIYISLGSIVQMETKEVLEMAWGLSNSNQPFLWVIRPGSIAGSEWIESLPEEVNRVLGHLAVGGFWSHCGWNSTLESIVEGVPMICRPFDGEQKLNVLSLESIWRIGFQVQSEVERGGVERAVKRLIVEEDGAKMRERALFLKENLKAAVRSGGSSYNALEEIVNYLKRE
ncbi:predicted protein [Arabidopsis lyrata subsp. lyrata]|uniref:Predicted protein n=1 Tax=Arabidopsis lyrata subsp. lyrata TaxID=81972 RepID=D7LN38_ARALL|nr:predicted protein [Arabidopsis lyrata subsp. lyrata]